jgi:hypothetical protein
LQNYNEAQIRSPALAPLPSRLRIPSAKLPPSTVSFLLSCLETKALKNGSLETMPFEAEFAGVAKWMSRQGAQVMLKNRKDTQACGPAGGAIEQVRAGNQR